MKRLLAILATVVVLAVMLARLYAYYAPPAERRPYAAVRPHDDTLRIAYIGDSWAFRHASHACTLARQVEALTGRPVTVTSVGLCGQTSKEIYQSFFSCDLLRRVLSTSPDYCFVSAGVNDTYKKMGRTYYQQSMGRIVGFLQAIGSTPVVLEIPDYDIAKAYAWQPASRQLLRRFSMWLTGSALDCRADYRTALDEWLAGQASANEVIVVRRQEWEGRGEPDNRVLYDTDGMHLNATGYARLDSCLATVIARHYAQSHTAE